jgi:hypothetical protein
MIAEVLLIRRARHVVATRGLVVDLVIAIRLRLPVHDEIGHDSHSIDGAGQAASPIATSNRRVQASASAQPHGSWDVLWHNAPA